MSWAVGGCSRSRIEAMSVICAFRSGEYHTGYLEELLGKRA
jgi:hypothetical protein